MRKRDLALSFFEAAVASLVGAQGPLSPSFTYRGAGRFPILMSDGPNVGAIYWAQIEWR